MSLPTKTDLQKLNLSKDGSPFCFVTAKSGIDTNPLNFSKDGSPWWAIAESAPAPAIKIFLGAIGIPKLYVGSTAVTKVYLGSIEI